MSAPRVYERQLKELLTQQGLDRFRAAYPQPFLIFLGLVGQLNANINAEATTMAVPNAAEIALTAMVGRVFEIARRSGPSGPTSPITLGRDSACDICIPEYSISKRHCDFLLAGQISVRDSGSTNGTVIDGAKIPPRQAHDLKGGETLVMGRFAFRFHTPTSYGAAG
jgi:pSer/pThr/pTyr-binding forkhead associated (FHA) protein